MTTEEIGNELGCDTKMCGVSKNYNIQVLLPVVYPLVLQPETKSIRTLNNS